MGDLASRLQGTGVAYQQQNPMQQSNPMQQATQLVSRMPQAPTTQQMGQENPRMQAMRNMQQMDFRGK
jgi:hypothetical protein